MHEDKLVSIIIPVYNVENYLPCCLNSILSSTYNNLQIICINDGSTDGSLGILQEYARKDSRIIIIDSKTNKGQAIARNKGLDLATGDYIAFVDSDDFVDPDFFKKMVLSIDDSDVIVCNYFVTNEMGNRNVVVSDSIEVLSERNWWEKYTLKNRLYFNVVWNKLYKRECFLNKRFTEDVIFEDTDIQHRLLENKTIKQISEILYFYRKRENSTLTRGVDENNIYRIVAMTNRAKYFNEKNWRRAKAMAICDAIKYSYKLKCSFGENSDAQLRLHDYTNDIKQLISFMDWLCFEDKLKCFYILYIDDLLKDKKQR